jgi:hypothetical protein
VEIGLWYGIFNRLPDRSFTFLDSEEAVESAFFWDN